jgi:hypothetical protein
VGWWQTAWQSTPRARIRYNTTQFQLFTRSDFCFLISLLFVKSLYKEIWKEKGKRITAARLRFVTRSLGRAMKIFKNTLRAVWLKEYVFSL